MVFYWPGAACHYILEATSPQNVFVTKCVKSVDASAFPNSKCRTRMGDPGIRKSRHMLPKGLDIVEDLSTAGPFSARYLFHV